MKGSKSDLHRKSAWDGLLLSTRKIGVLLSAADWCEDDRSNNLRAFGVY